MFWIMLTVLPLHSAFFHSRHLTSLCRKISGIINTNNTAFRKARFRGIAIVHAKSQESVTETFQWDGETNIRLDDNFY